MIKGYLTTEQVAEKLEISAGRVRQFIAFGRLPAVKVGHTNLVKETDLNLIIVRQNGQTEKKRQRNKGIKEMKNGKKEITSKNGNFANGQKASEKPKLNKPVSKMTVDELAENFESNELMRMAFEIRAKYRKKGIVIE